MKKIGNYKLLDDFWEREKKMGKSLKYLGKEERTYWKEAEERKKGKKYF